MSDLEDLYREIILDHYRSPRNRGELDVPPAVRTEGFNPLCGDEIVVYLQLDDPAKGDDATVTDVTITGQGCSISQSSASMMSAAIKGRTVSEVREISGSFKSMMSVHEGSLEGGEPPQEDSGLSDPEALGDLAALRGVVKFPVRIKCATLAWNTLAEALSEATAAAG
ncbi:MAG: SUF system NifU family Fe-S cluster assembly protein [Microthrixaceae bacterium]|nr:SUF system NifU family Fe-S cluster assembly protein [Microthrixaceae bacterium]